MKIFQLFRLPQMLRPHRRALLTLSAGAGLFIVAFTGLPASAAHNAAWVNGNVEWPSPTAGSAKNTVLDWESGCTDAFNSNKASMPHRTEDEQRQVVNASAYDGSVWLSRKGDPRNVITTPVTSGSSINMQINDIGFLCAIITMNPSGFTIAGDHKVTNTNYPNDRSPVPDSGAAQYKVNQASRYESNSHIYGISISKGPGTITSSPVGQVMGYKRDSTSRYWLDTTPPQFTYKVPAGLAPGTYTITIDLEYATIQTYHDYGSGGTSRCTLKSNGDGANVGYGQFYKCEHRTSSYKFTFTVVSPIPPASVRPQSTVDKAQMSYPDTATFTHSLILVSGSASNDKVNYSIQRTRNGVAVGGPQTGTYTFSGSGTIKTNTYASTAADAGATICESLSLSNVAGGTLTIIGSPSTACTTVASEPYLKVFGGDISAGNGRVTAPANTCTPNPSGSVVSWNLGSPSYRGAGAQYATYALGVITEFATAQGNVGGAPTPSGLAFANTTAAGSTYGGAFATAPCIPDYYPQSLTGYSGFGGGSVSGLATGGYTKSGLTTIDASTITGGHRVQLFINGDVYIKGNLTYGGNWSSDQIPLLEIVAQGNIYIDKGVTQLDGAYIAQRKSDGTGGTIYTCTTGAEPYETSNSLNDLLAQCGSSQLKVNGALTAYAIQFLRAKGTLSDSATDSALGLSSSAAEQLDYNPALWIAQPTSNTGPSTSYDAVTSLPPIL